MNIEKTDALLNEFRTLKFDCTIWIIANVNNTVQDEESFIQHSCFSEFFSKSEYASIISAIAENFGYIRTFYSETEFIKYVLDNLTLINKQKHEILIFNFSRDGISEGKKSLIPAFCDLYGLNYTSSNAFVISLLRNKFIFTKYLETMGIPVPFTVCSQFLDNNSFKKLKGKEIIIKNIFESASIGLDETNIIKTTDYILLLSKINNLQNKMKSTNLLIQEYIKGKECEVFVIKVKDTFYSFDPIMLNINKSNIITSKISDEYDYTFSPLSRYFSKDVCKKICHSAEKAAQFLNIKNYARFDYRISDNGDFFLIDIAGSPYLTRHSSVEYLFTKILKYKYSDIFSLIIAISILNYSHEVNCKSDSNSPLDI